MSGVREPLTEDDVRSLPEGAPITVTWSGGNGPHDYVLTFDKRGEPHAMRDEGDRGTRMQFYNPLRFVGPMHYETRVWSRVPSTSEGEGA